MSEQLPATCDNCGKVFNVKFREKKHPGKIIETYFRCPRCKKKYFCFAKDEKVRELQELIKREESPFKRVAMQREINERMNKLKERLT